MPAVDGRLKARWAGHGGSLCFLEVPERWSDEVYAWFTRSDGWLDGRFGCMGWAGLLLINDCKE